MPSAFSLFISFNRNASMADDESQSRPPLEADSSAPPPLPPPPPFDPCRMIGIIKRKALVKELAAAYHAECLLYCQELLELQRKWDEPYIELKVPEDPRKKTMKPSKRQKKAR
ncbi:hypothetical protein SDJN03_11003, partial [Cucurbita argyrosperma subsp. sororia]